MYFPTAQKENVIYTHVKKKWDYFFRKKNEQYG